MNKNIPAVSIVIPMYNAEKYIGECLDSILAQTFDDYEVIVVDDCSTDNSATIVEEYALKFEKFTGGRRRLQLVRRKTNSGGAAAPRNTGMKVARGEYIFLMDSDDALTPTAFEEFYGLAVKFSADAVYCKRHYVIGADEKAAHLRSDFPMRTVDNQTVGDTVTVETEDLALRIQQMCSWQFNLMAWGALIKRDLILENELTFPGMKIYDDFAFIFKVQCLAQKFVHTPKPVYLYRVVPTSITHSSRKTLEQLTEFWIGSLIGGMRDLDKFMDGMEFFQKNLEYRYAVTTHLANFIFRPFLGVGNQVPPHFIYAATMIAEGAKLGEQSSLVAYLISRLSVQQQNIQQQQQQIQQLQAQLQAQPSQFQLSTEDIFK